VNDIATVRRRYAEMMTSALARANPRLRDAYATVPREAFAGPPPWTLFGAGHRPLRAAHPAELYQDALIALDTGKGVNNGSPSLHAAMLDLLDVRACDQVLHVGTGGGYYTALLAELAGPDGAVTGVEFDHRLAGMARDNLRPWPWVRLVHGDGAAFPTGPTQRIYVSFALADPADPWLDMLTLGGRLVFPLGVADPRAPASEQRHSARAAVLAVTRTPDGFDARFDGPVAFICAEGPASGDTATRAALFAAFRQGGLDSVRSLHRGAGPDGRTWFSSARWSLATDPPGQA
jgi:protein-L-isoaspartate(D-aspartate) O-methyltransferase